MDFSNNLPTYAVFPIEAVFVKRISPTLTLISGDSSYLKNEI